MGNPTKNISKGNPAYVNTVSFRLVLNSSVSSTGFPLDVGFRGQLYLAGLRGTVSLAATRRCLDVATGGHSVT